VSWRCVPTGTELNLAHPQWRLLIPVYVTVCVLSLRKFYNLRKNCSKNLGRISWNFPIYCKNIHILAKFRKNIFSLLCCFQIFSPLWAPAFIIYAVKYSPNYFYLFCPYPQEPLCQSGKCLQLPSSRRPWQCQKHITNFDLCWKKAKSLMPWWKQIPNLTKIFFLHPAPSRLPNSIHTYPNRSCSAHTDACNPNETNRP